MFTTVQSTSYEPVILQDTAASKVPLKRLYNEPVLEFMLRSMRCRDSLFCCAASGETELRRDRPSPEDDIDQQRINCLGTRSSRDLKILLLTNEAKNVLNLANV